MNRYLYHSVRRSKVCRLPQVCNFCGECLGMDFSFYVYWDLTRVISVSHSDRDNLCSDRPTPVHSGGKVII